MEYDLARFSGNGRVPSLGDILKNVVPTSTETTRGKEVFIFRPQIFKETKGIIFPNDDIISLRNPYDVIVNNLSVKREKGFLILSEIYHEFSIGDIFPVKISGRSTKHNPMFQLFGFFGFVNSGELEVGQKVYVRVRKMKEGLRDNILETELYSYI